MSLGHHIQRGSWSKGAQKGKQRKKMFRQKKNKTEKKTELTHIHRAFYKHISNSAVSPRADI